MISLRLATFTVQSKDVNRNLRSEICGKVYARGVTWGFHWTGVEFA